MGTAISFIFQHAIYAHWVIFGLLLLAGLNFPISEDLLIIISGFLSSTVVPENTWKLFMAVFLGAYISDFFPFFIGRTFGDRLWNLSWFSKMLKPEKLEQIKKYYARYGILTLIVGRFIPFGVRNCLFLSAGIGRMRMWKFALGDGIACLLSNITLFTLSYLLGKNYTLLTERLKLLNIIVFSAFVIALIALFCYKKKKSPGKEVE